MLDLEKRSNPYRDDKVIGSCSIFGMMDLRGRCVEGQPVFEAMSNMRERSNGLGAGFAIYGLYPSRPKDYAFHVMYESAHGKELAEAELARNFDVVHAEEIPTNPQDGVTNGPMLWRYFVRPPSEDGVRFQELVAREVTRINTTVKDAYVFSSAKNMGVFKGVGFPEDIAKFYVLDEYRGYIWLAHGRFPTNTQAWWGGAHPFSFLDWAVVHNGELSSYGANKRFVEDYGYRCNFFTDTEVVAYAIDLLVRRHGLGVEMACKVLAPPVWVKIDGMPESKKALYSSLRISYSGLLLNGPFSVIIGREGEMIGLTDRIKLRPLTAATGNGRLYLASEEAPIRLVDGDLERVWSPLGGVPVIGRVGQGICYEEEGA